MNKNNILKWIFINRLLNELIGNYETGVKMAVIKKRVLNGSTVKNQKSHQYTDSSDSANRGHTNEVLCLALSDDSKFLVETSIIKIYLTFYFKKFQKPHSLPSTCPFWKTF
jgi:hypothetical protein